MSVYGYPRATTPAIDALGDAGVVFERAIAQWPKTGPSMASAFIGQYPQTTGITHKAAVKLPEAYLTLPEFFKHLGFAPSPRCRTVCSPTAWAGMPASTSTWRLGPRTVCRPIAKSYAR